MSLGCPTQRIRVWKSYDTRWRPSDTQSRPPSRVICALSSQQPSLVQQNTPSPHRTFLCTQRPPLHRQHRPHRSPLFLLRGRRNPQQSSRCAFDSHSIGSSTSTASSNDPQHEPSPLSLNSEHREANEHTVNGRPPGGAPEHPSPPPPPPPPPIPKPKSFRRNWVLDLVLWRIRLRDFVASRLGDDELSRRLAVTFALLLATRVGRFIPLRALPGCGGLLTLAPAAAAAVSVAGKSVGGSVVASLGRKEEAWKELLAASTSTGSLGGLAPLEAADALSPELTLFTLGIGPYIAASVLMQMVIATRIFPYLTVLQEEGAQGIEALEKITSAVCMMVGFISGMAAVIVSPQGPQVVSKAVIPALWLASGAVWLKRVSSGITKNGIGDGTSMLVALDILSLFVASVGPSLTAHVQSLNLTLPSLPSLWPSLTNPTQSILTCTQHLHSLRERMLALAHQHLSLSALQAQVSSISVDSLKSALSGGGKGTGIGQENRVFVVLLGVVAFFILSSATALFVGAVRRIRLQYFDFETPSPFSSSSPIPNGADEKGSSSSSSAEYGGAEVAPHVPFPILPSGMYPLFAASMITSFLSIVIKFAVPKLHAVLESASSQGPWSPQSLLVTCGGHFALVILVVLLNSASMDDSLKDISENLTSIGARIPGVRPGTATLDHLRDARDSARFVGGILLAGLTLCASCLDHVFWSLTSIRPGFPSLLIIVGSVIALRRSVEAHRQIPKLLAVLESSFKASPTQEKMQEKKG